MKKEKKREKKEKEKRERKSVNENTEKKRLRDCKLQGKEEGFFVKRHNWRFASPPPEKSPRKEERE